MNAALGQSAPPLSPSPSRDGVVLGGITVLVGASVHPSSQRPMRCRSDALAVALALSLQGVSGAGGLRLLSAGALPEAVARDYLALGAPLLETLEGAVTTPVLDVLLPALQAVPWILLGTRSVSEHGSGVLAFALAAALQRPLVTEVLAVQPQADGWIVTQALPKGGRRRLRVQAPALLVVSAAASLALRHSLADALAGQIVRSATTAATAIATVPAVLLPRSQRRQVLVAASVQSGRARLLGATESPARGGALLHSGSPQAKAQAVLDYLRRHSLVNF